MSSSTHIKILVVDDDWISLSIVSSLLRKMSYEVVTVKSPVDAIATLRMQRDYFDLVVTDLHMPLMNGSQLAKQVNLEFKNIPVILMSADDKESVMMECLESGAVYYIIKPINPDDLKNVWQFASAAKKGKSRALQEIMENVTLQDLENINLDDDHDDDDEDDNMVDHSHNNEHTSKMDSGGSKKRKASRSPENEGTGSNGVKLKKRKVVWTTVLHNLFLQAVRHIGLDKAVPKKILGFMSVPGLTRENVASHLQKYRLFLKKLAMNNACPTRNVLSDRALRSSFVDPSMSLMLMQQLYPNQMVMRSRGGYGYAAGGAGHGFNSYGQNKARLSSLGPPLFPSSCSVVRPQNRYINNGQYQYPPASNFQQPMLFGATNTPNPFQANHNSYYGARSSLSNNFSFNSGTNNSLRLYQAQRNYGASSSSNNFNRMGSNCSSNEYYNPKQLTPPRNYNAGNEMTMSANASNNMNELNSSSSARLIGNPTATMTVATGFGNTNQLINNPILAMPVGNNTNCSNATTLRGNLGHGNLHELSYSCSSAAQIANANQCNPVSPMLGDSMGQMGAQLAFAGGTHNGNQLNTTANAGGSENSYSLDDLLASTTITTNSTLNNNNNNSVHSDIFGHAIDLDAIFNNPLQQQDKSKEVMSSNGSANPSMNGEVNFDDLSDLFPMELENASWNGQSLVQNQASQEVENTNFGSASTPLFQFGDINVVASFGQNPSQNQVSGHDAISNFNMINNSTVQLNNGYQLNFQHNTNQNEVSEGVVGGGSMHQTNDYNSSFMIQNPSQQQDMIGGGSMIQNVNDQDHWSDNGLMQFFYNPN